jgi:hypothetical protein
MKISLQVLCHPGTAALCSLLVSHITSAAALMFGAHTPIYGWGQEGGKASALAAFAIIAIHGQQRLLLCTTLPSHLIVPQCSN